MYIQCDSTLHRKTFITRCKETVQLAHSRNTSYIYFHMVFYTKACWLSWTTGSGPGLSSTLNFNFNDFPGPGYFREKIHDVPGLSRKRGKPVIQRQCNAWCSRSTKDSTTLQCSTQ